MDGSQVLTDEEIETTWTRGGTSAPTMEVDPDSADPDTKDADGDSTDTTDGDTGGDADGTDS